MLTVIIFLLILGLLVLVHELGHFQVARRLKIGVEEFGLGFPPRAWSKVKKGITYSLNWIPLGGFVKIKGENGEAPAEADSFSFQPFWKKTLVLVAGVFMNVLLGWVLLTFSLIIGMPGAIDKGSIDQNQSVQIIQVIPKSAAFQAGLQIGDVVKSINQQSFNTPEDYVKYINLHRDESLTIGYLRDQTEFKVTAKPTILPGQNNKVLGLQLAQVGLISYPWWQAPAEAFKLTIFILWQIISSLINLIVSLINGLGLNASLAGPVGVAVMTGQMVDLGFRYVIQFAALLSLNLAVVNILPIPALDGGRLLFALIEKLRRRPNRASLENAFHQTGFVVLLCLVALITYKDIALYAADWWQKLNKFF